MAQVPKVTPEHVREAYEALASGDKETVRKYWSDDMQWLVPGHHQLSGWKRNLDEFLAFMAKVGELSANSFQMETIDIMTSDEYSADVTHNTGRRAEDPNKKLDIDVVHVLQWRDGRVIEAKAGIFGEGTAQFNEFWGQE